jgi:hypothetical protein
LLPALHQYGSGTLGVAVALPDGDDRRVWGGEDFASILGLFTGAAALVWISIVGMRRFRAWTVVALTSVSVVWSLTWIGTLVGGNSMLNNPNAVGYWLMVVGVGVVIVGTALVWASSRRARLSTPDTTAAAMDD